MFSKLFSPENHARLWDNVEKYGTARLATRVYNTRIRSVCRIN